jgi:phosphatidylinositol dimannoside acyltransferase
MSDGRLRYRTYVVLGRALGAVPEPIALGGARVVGDVLFHLRPEQRAQVAANLGRVVGGEPADAVILDQWARRAFHAYARYWVEGARLGGTPRREVVERTFVQGLHHLVDGMAAGNGVIMALPHIGSWEYGGAFLAASDLPMTAVAERIEPPALYRYFVEQRAAIGLTVIPLDANSGRAILAELRRGGLVGLLSDRDIEGTGVDVEFFGEKTTMPAGPAALALRSGARLVTGAVYSGPGRDHRGVVEPPIDLTRKGSLRSDVARITQEIAHRFEGLVRAAPEQWHVFQPFWTADRDQAAT